MVEFNELLEQLKEKKKNDFEKFQKCSSCGYEQKIDSSKLSDQFLNENGKNLSDENIKNGVFPFIMMMQVSGIGSNTSQLLACPVCGAVKLNLNIYDRFEVTRKNKETKEKVEYLKQKSYNDTFTGSSYTWYDE